MLILLAILVLSVIKICHLQFLQHIYAVFKSCFQYICDLRCICHTVDQTIACTIATCLIHSKTDYSNSFLLNLPTL